MSNMAYTTLCKWNTYSSADPLWKYQKWNVIRQNVCFQMCTLLEPCIRWPPLNSQTHAPPPLTKRWNRNEKKKEKHIHCGCFFSKIDIFKFYNTVFLCWAPSTRQNENCSNAFQRCINCRIWRVCHPAEQRALSIRWKCTTCNLFCNWSSLDAVEPDTCMVAFYATAVGLYLLHFFLSFS